MKIAVVVFAENARPGEIAGAVEAMTLFRAVIGVARAETGGVYEVDVPVLPHEPIWEAFRRLDIKFQESP